MNPELARLQPYPFEKLRALLDGITPANKPYIALSVGEPKHDAPQFVLDALVKSLRGVENYPSTRGSEEFRHSVANWLCQRFSLDNAQSLASHHILPVNGTREALFAIAQCVLDRTNSATDVLMPNPFYQIYEGAVLLAGCKPAFYTISANGDNDVSAITDKQFDACQMFYLCNPGNPTGSVLSQSVLQQLIEKAHQHNFLIVSDECYSEIYRESAGPPTGLLQAAYAMGNSSYKHCLVFHSLSKRSNLPGLRSGFIAGDQNVVEQFLLYRTYHGCSMSPPVQHASAVAWQDEKHVQANRCAYDEKYDAVLSILQPLLDVHKPDAGFYLWPTLPVDDAIFTQTMLREQNVALVPGSYLGREVMGLNPGANHVRLALVAQLEECVDAATRIANALAA